MSTADSSPPFAIMLLLFIFSVLVACTGKTSASDKCLDLNPPVVVVRYEDSFSVNCTSLSNETKGMGWESPFKPVTLQDGVTSLVYEVDRVTVWQLSPQCYVNYINNAHQCIETLPVKIYKTPDNVSISKPKGRGALVEGDAYTVQCNITNVAPANNLFIYWYKGDEVIYKNTFNSSATTPSNESVSLNLIAKREDHQSEIWCEAGLDFSQGPKLPRMPSKRQELIVMYAPAFDEPGNETLKTGGTIILSCNSTGNPTPSYKWNGPEPIKHLIKGENQNQLILTRSSQIIGFYNCVASNSIGSNTKGFEIISVPGNRTTFEILLGVFIALAVLLAIGGLVFVTKEGTCSFNRGSYEPGRPTSGAV